MESYQVFKYTILLHLLSLSNFNCQNIQDAVDLYNDIMKNYRKEILPVWDEARPFNLDFNLYLHTINSLEESKETVSIIVTCVLKWMDPKLTWNPSSYGNKTNMTITTNDIWLPYVYLANSVESMKPLGKNSQFYAIVMSNGYVFWAPGDVLKAKFYSDSSKFPFDMHICHVTFTMFSVKHVIYTNISTDDMLDYYYPNSDWKITASEQFVSDDGRYFGMVLSVKREPLYYVVIVILPTLLFALLNPTVFLLPVESGERISLGITILLSYTTFLTLVTNTVPASSNPLCILLVVMVLIMIISGIIVIFIIVSAHYYHVSHVSEVNACLIWLTMCCLPRKRHLQIKSGEVNIDDFVSGKDIARVLDIIFTITSYLVLILIISGYVILVLIV